MFVPKKLYKIKTTYGSVLLVQKGEYYQFRNASYISLPNESIIFLIREYLNRGRNILVFLCKEGICSTWLMSGESLIE